MMVEVILLSDLINMRYENKRPEMINVLGRDTITELANEFGVSKQLISQKIDIIFKNIKDLVYAELSNSKEGFIVIENDVNLSLQSRVNFLTEYSFSIKFYTVLFENKETYEEFVKIYNNLNIEDFYIPYDIKKNHRSEIEIIAVNFYLENYNPIRSLTGRILYLDKLSIEENLRMFLKNHSRNLVSKYFSNFKTKKTIYNYLKKE
jgi:hypothetical protein